MEDKRQRFFEKHPGLTILSLVVLVTVTADLLLGLLLIPGETQTFRSPHPSYHHGMLPLKSALARWGEGSVYPVHTNSLGFLDRAQRQVALSFPGRRILLIGDSMAEGLGLPFEKTFAGILQERLEPSGIDLLNASAISYSPRLYDLKVRYMVEIAGLQFDELVVLIDISDIQDEVLYRKFLPRDEEERLPLLAALKEEAKRFSYLTYALETLASREKRERKRQKYNPNLYPPWLDYFWLDDTDTEPFDDTSFVHLREAWTDNEHFDKKWTVLGLELATANMASLARFCREEGIGMTVVVYPWPHQIGKRDRESRQVRHWREFSRSEDISFLNLFPEFIGRPGMEAEEVRSGYYIDGDIHWNEAGHRLVADKLHAYLKESGRAP